MNQQTPFNIRNIRQFIKFRVFFNSRFYYPVFTILFLDFGLTLEQFAVLNAVWAATIVLCEVPSGALADTLGRRNLLVFAGFLMVLEISLLCVAPPDHSNWLFVIFLGNRVLSGIAEAAASGADEALAYDSLVKQGDPAHWGHVLEIQMRFQSLAFIVAMSAGAAVYDPAFMQSVTDILGLRVHLDQGVTIRFPLYLTLVMAFLTLISARRMTEVAGADNVECALGERCVKSVTDAWRLTIEAGRWILKTPFALVIIVVGLTFDHIIRMVITLESQYLRLIQFPEASFGLIGSGLALLGFFIPRMALKLVAHRPASFNLWVVALMSLIGLTGMAFFTPLLGGLIPLVVVFSVMYMMNLFVSHYLNRITDSSRRATVLSFKGMSFNLAYGVFGMAYSALLSVLRNRALTSNPGTLGPVLENRVFIESIGWFPRYFILIFSVVAAFSYRMLRNTPRQLSDSGG